MTTARSSAGGVTATDRTRRIATTDRPTDYAEAHR